MTAVQERAIRVQLAAEAMRQDGWVWLPGRPLIAATALLAESGPGSEHLTEPVVPQCLADLGC